MTSLTDSLVGALRRLSGDRKKAGMSATEATAIVDTGDGHGGTGADPASETEDKTADQAEGRTSIDDTVCFACTKDWSSLKNKGVPLECSFCKNWFCMSCADIPKKGDITAISRPDVFWACKQCISWAKVTVEQLSERPGEPGITNPNTPETQGDLVKALRNLELNLEKKIDETVRAVVPKIVTECLSPIKDDVSHKVNENVTMLWNQTLFGKDDYPTLQDAAKDKNVKPKRENKIPQGPLVTAVKQAVTEQKNEELKRENNIIIHRLPERQETTHEARKSAETKIVNEILEAIETQVEITQINRLGRFKKPVSDEQIKPRPLKVTFKDNKIQQEVMLKMYMLKDAPAHLQSLSVCYDLTETERAKQKELVNAAKEKTQNDPNWRYKIVGPPWDLQERRIRKKKIESQNTEPTPQAGSMVGHTVEND